MGKKTDVLKSQNDSVIYTKGYGDYYIAKTHDILIDTLQMEYNNKRNPCIFEYINGSDTENSKVNIYFDLDGDSLEGINEAIGFIKAKIDSYFNDFDEIRYISTVSTGFCDKKNKIKYSYHLIVRLKNNGKHYYLKNVDDMKLLYGEGGFYKITGSKDEKPIIDISVYRGAGGLFRTLYSSKPGENRPFIQDPENSSPDVKDIETFVRYHPDQEPYEIIDINTILGRFQEELGKIDPLPAPRNEITDDLKLEDTPPSSELDPTIIKIIVKIIYSFNVKITTLYKGKQEDYGYLISFKPVECPFKGAMHSSNNNYLKITPYTIYYRCFSANCKGKGKTKPTIQLIDKADYIKLFPNERKVNTDLCSDYSIELEMTNYLKGIDKGVSKVFKDMENGGYRTPTTSRIDPKYTILEPHTHQITPNEHLIKGRWLTAKITDYDKSNIYKIYNQTINIVNNINVKKSTGLKTFKTNDITIFDGIEYDIEVIDEVKRWIKRNTTHYSLVCIYLKIRKDEVITYCDSVYLYDTDRGLWVEDKKGNKVIGDVQNKLIELMNVLIEIAIKTTEEDLTTFLMSWLSKIGMEQTVKSVFNLLKGLTEKNGLDLFDNDWTIIPFDNGVFDLKTKAFRQAKKEDYISKTTKYDYNPDAESDITEKFLKNIIPNDEERCYLIKTVSSFLDGRIPNDFITILLGEGSNGKSVFLNLIGVTFGALGKPAASTIFTRADSDSSKARPDLYDLTTARVGYIVEPEEDHTTFNSAVIKRMCGSDKISCRTLYGPQREYWARTKFILSANKLPKIPPDDALIRRLRIVKFTQTFLDTPNSEGNIRDPLLTDKIKNDMIIRQSFMNILLKYSLFEQETVLPIAFKSVTTFLKSEVMDLENFLLTRVKKSYGSILSKKEIINKFSEYNDEAPPAVNSYLYKKLSKRIDDYFITKGNMSGSYGNHRLDTRKRKMGWKDYTIKDEEDSSDS